MFTKNWKYKFGHIRNSQINWFSALNCIPQTLAAGAFVSHRCVRLVSRHLLSGRKYFLARGSPMGLGNLPPHTAPRSRHTAPRSDCPPSTLSAHMQILHLRIHSRVSPHTNHQLRICYVMLVWFFFPLEVGQSPDDVVQCVFSPTAGVTVKNKNADTPSHDLAPYV